MSVIARGSWCVWLWLTIKSFKRLVDLHTRFTMDIGRGSRRARHVAANVAAAAAAAEAESEEVDSEPAEETRQERGRHLEPLAAAAAQTHVHANAHAHAHAHALTTPGATVINSTQTPSLQYDLNSSLERPGAPPVRRLQPQGTPNYSHRTPEQVYTRGASPPGVGGPPPNPFRLHRSELLYVAFFFLTTSFSCFMT